MNQDTRHTATTRAARGPAALPTDPDDLRNMARKDRNWKRFRRSRYRQSD